MGNLDTLKQQHCWSEGKLYHGVPPHLLTFKTARVNHLSLAHLTIKD